MNGDVLFRVTELAEEERRFFIGFGMDTRIIENLVRTRNAEEARALLKRLRTDAGNLFDFGALLKFAVFLAVFDDVLG